MIVPLLVFLGVAAVLTYSSMQWDNEDWKALADNPPIKIWDIIKLRLVHLWSCWSSQQQVLPMANVSSTETEAVTVTAEEIALLKERKNRARNEFQNRIKGKAVGSEHTILDDSLPKVFRSGTLIDKLVGELLRHHRWLSILYHFSTQYSRALRVLALFTNVVTFLFFVAFTYSTAYPGDNQCSSFLTAADCRAPKSDFATGRSECIWDNRREYCSYIQPSVVIRIILFVVLFAMLLATPINMATNWLVKHILASPLAKPDSKYALVEHNSEQEGSGGGGSGDGPGSHTPPVHPQKPQPSISSSNSNCADHEKSLKNNNGNYKNSNVIKEKPSTQPGPEAPAHLRLRYRTAWDHALQELATLEADIRQHRDANLKCLIDRRKFDRIWGLDPSGHFIKADVAKPSDPYLQRQAALCGPDTARIRKDVVRDIVRAQRLETHHVEVIQRTDMSDAEVGKVLLFCLQCDLLDGIEGRILERKGDRDCEKVFPVQLPWKVFAWVVIIAINIAFLAYILQFAATQSAPRQTAWFKSFVLYLALEIAGISTNHVLITHFSLPCLAFVRTQRMKEILCKRIQKHGIDVEKSLLAPLAPPPAGSSAAGAAAGLRAAQEHEGSSSTMTFNAARYLYASYRLSCCFPVSRESQIVRLCSTQVPRQAHFLETEVKAAPVEVVADKAMQDHTWKNIKFLLASAFSSLYRNLLVPVLWAALWLPLSVQDSLLEWITVVLFGYILLLHIRLYEIYPLVAFLPAFVFMVLGHFYVVSGNAEVQVAIAKLKTDAIKARALQRKLHEKRLDIEAAQQAAEESTNGGADGAGGGQAGQDERDISPVHESVKRSSALRVSLSLSGTSTKSGGGSGSSRRNSQPATPAGGAATGTDSSEKFESRLHHFLASADKVLQSQQEHAPVVVATSSAGEGTGGGAGTTVTGGSSPPHAPHERSVPSLRAVDSFYQQKAATTAATTPKATAEPSPNTAMDASSADAAAEKPKRLMKKASFQT